MTDGRTETATRRTSSITLIIVMWLNKAICDHALQTHEVEVIAVDRSEY